MKNLFSGKRAIRTIISLIVIAGGAIWYYISGGNSNFHFTWGNTTYDNIHSPNYENRYLNASVSVTHNTDSRADFAVQITAKEDLELLSLNALLTERKHVRVTPPGGGKKYTTTEYDTRKTVKLVEDTIKMTTGENKTFKGVFADRIDRKSFYIQVTGELIYPKPKKMSDKDYLNQLKDDQDVREQDFKIDMKFELNKSK